MKSGASVLLTAPLLNTLTSNMVTYEHSEGEHLQPSSLFDALRNTYISEKISSVFCKDTKNNCMEQLAGVSPERQAIVESFVTKFINLTDEEKLLFFLRLPISTNNGAHSPCESKLGVLASRVEIRRTAAWIRSHLQEDSDASLPKRDVYDKYLEYCQGSRMIPIAIADFGKVMKHLYPSVRPRRLGTRGKSQYCYAGMSSCQDVKRPDIYEDGSTSCIESLDCGLLASGSHNEDYRGNQRVHSQLVLQDPCIMKKEYPVCAADHLELLASDSSSNEVPKEILDVQNFQSTPCDTSQICYFSEKKCRTRKALLSKRDRLKRYVPVQSKDNCVEQINDGQVEEEVAQYFQSDKHDFCRPLKVVKRSASRPSFESFHRSLSYSGGVRDITSLESRSQSSVGIYGPSWAPYKSPTSCRYSASSVVDGHHTPYRSASREATEKLAQLQLRPRSCVTRNSIENMGSSSGATHNLGFTPISPSPLPLQPYFPPIPDNPQMFSEPDENTINPGEFSLFRPRSFSSTEAKWNNSNSFNKQSEDSINNQQCILEGNNSTWEENFETKPVCSEEARSQSLPSFKNGEGLTIPEVPINFEPDNEFNSIDQESVNGITCEELTDMIENSMVVENITFRENEKYDQNLFPQENEILPQSFNMFDSIKHPTDVMIADVFSTKANLDNYSIPPDDINTINETEQSFRPNFETFF